MNVETNVPQFTIVKNTRDDGISVMDAPAPKLIEIVFDWLSLIDDLIQVAAEKGDENESENFASDYHKLEGVYFHIKEGVNITDEIRNKIRILLKDVNKRALVLQWTFDEHNELVEKLRLKYNN